MPGHHLETRKSRSVDEVLAVTVVGGSIAGLASAFTLAKAGHRVTVLEATDGRNKRRGALKLPPNGTLCLNRWGLKKHLDKFSRKFMRCIFIRSEYDRVVGTLLLNALLQHEAFSNQNVADYTFIKDSDLWDWLYKLATDSGATFRPNSRVVKIDSSRCSATLENGDEVPSDFIVGADGVGGIVRSVISGRRPDSSGSRFLTIACTIPCDDFHKDPELSTVLNESSLFIWAGEGVQLQGQMGKGAKTYTITMGYKIPPGVTLDPSIKDFEWYDNFRLEDFVFIDYTKFVGRPLKLLDLCRGVKAYASVHVEQPLLDDLVCDGGMIVLVGDAAHGMPPGMQHNASLGLEDAEALGYLFARVPSRLLIPRLLMAYEEIRSPRIAHGSQIDVSLLHSWIMPEGPMRDQFDGFLAKSAAQEMSDQLDEDLSVLWSETLSMWLYDATEKAEDWWSKWGTGILREFLEPGGRATAIHVDRNISHQ